MGKILIVNTGPVRELSAEAVAQAVAERLSEYKLAAVYYCPLPGAEEMARFIAGRLGLQVQPLPGLSEATSVTLDDLAVKHKKETVVIISEQALSVTMLLHLLGLNSKHYGQIDQQPGSVNLFEFRLGVPSALYINDTCHLNKLI
ncbi:MAG: histidine phosphatase family protein [Dehalococcoidia bacterium]|nr:histidine phosphatase family protein [Dehalococcoidia bacterium]